MVMPRFTAVALAAAMALSVSAAHAADKLGTVRIHDYPGTGNMLFRTAATKGYCEKYGITCQLQTIPNGPLGLQALLARSIDVAFVPTEVQIAAMVKGAAIKAIAAGSILSPFLVTVAAQSPLATGDVKYPDFMASLKGKKIGVAARGSATEFTFDIMLRDAGLQPDDVTYVAVGAPNTAYASLISHQVDAVMTFEPGGTMCDILPTCHTLWRAASAPQPAEIAATNGAATLLVVTEAYAKAQPAIVEALRKAAKDAETFLQNPQNFDEAVQIALKYFKFDMPNGDHLMTAVVRQAIPSYKVAIDRDAARAVAAYLLKTKQIQAPFDTSRLYLAGTP